MEEYTSFTDRALNAQNALDFAKEDALDIFTKEAPKGFTDTDGYEWNTPEDEYRLIGPAEDEDDPTVAWSMFFDFDDETMTFVRTEDGRRKRFYPITFDEFQRMYDNQRGEEEYRDLVRLVKDYELTDAEYADAIAELARKADADIDTFTDAYEFLEEAASDDEYNAHARKFVQYIVDNYTNRDERVVGVGEDGIRFDAYNRLNSSEAVDMIDDAAKAVNNTTYARYMDLSKNR